MNRVDWINVLDGHTLVTPRLPRNLYRRTVELGTSAATSTGRYGGTTEDTNFDEIVMSAATSGG